MARPAPKRNVELPDGALFGVTKTVVTVGAFVQVASTQLISMRCSVK
jgi:hypothetical protein